MIRTIRQVWGLLPRRLRRSWLMLGPLACVSAVLEMIGTAGVLALVELIANPTGPAAQRASSLLARLLPSIDEGRAALAFAVGLGLFYAGKNALRFAEAYLQARCAGRTATYISAGLVERYLRAPHELHFEVSSAELMQRVENGATAAGHVVLLPVVGLVSEILIVSGMLAVVIWHTPGGALAAAAFLGAVLAVLIGVTQRRHTAWGWRLHQLAGATLGSLQQSLASVREIKTYGREAFFTDRYRSFRDEQQQVFAKRQALEATPRLAVETVFIGGLALLFLLARTNAADAAGTTATLGVLAYAGLRLLPSMHLIVYRFNRIGQGEAVVDVIAADWERLSAFAHEGPPVEPPAFERSIVFRGVRYRYPSAERDALVAVDLEIRRGESIGLVGPTGSGKSTLADLAVGLLAPSEGSIEIDGRPLLGSERAWQRAVGYAPQTVHLLDDSLRRNIALGVADSEIDDGRVAEAVRQAQLQKFVDALPEGLDSMVGESGVKLSGGERQRVAIARALYRRPAVLLFDEATASLDNRTERAVTETIESLRGEKTLILIAHRLTTVERCDRLVFLLDGRVADVGTYAELIERNPQFRAMALSVDPPASGGFSPAPPARPLIR